MKGRAKAELLWGHRQSWNSLFNARGLPGLSNYEDNWMKEERDIMESIPEHQRIAANSNLGATWRNPEIRSQFRCHLFEEVFPHHSSPGLVSILRASTEPCAAPTTNTDPTVLWWFGSRPVSSITTVSSVREGTLLVFTLLFVVPNTVAAKNRYSLGICRIS